jgi:hypothetical protein
MTLRWTAQRAGASEDHDTGVFSAGVAAYGDGTGQAIILQRPMTEPGDIDLTKPYELVLETGAVTSGGLRTLTLAPKQLELLLSRDAVQELSLSSVRIVVTLNIDADSQRDLHLALTRLLADAHTSRSGTQLDLHLDDDGDNSDSAKKHTPWRPARTEYRVVSVAGPRAEVEVVGDPSAPRERVMSVLLSEFLGIPVDRLVGLHYTCRVDRARDGITRSDYQVAR